MTHHEDTARTTSGHVTKVETLQLKEPRVDPHLQAAVERVKAAAEKLVRLGIARPDGTRTRTDLPTRRSGITFEQAAIARGAGFVIEMRYLALQTFEMRIKMRTDMGCHSAPESILR